MNVKILIEKLNESLVRVLNELTVLHDAALSTVEATTQDELIEEVTTIVGKALFPTNFGILMLDESSHTITTHPSYRFMEGKQIWNLKVGEGITGQVAKTGKTLRVGDVRKNPYYLESDSRIRSELCVPIKAGKRVIGLINSEHTKHDAFTKDDQRLLSTIAGQIGPALDRLRAEESLRRQFNELAVIHSISTACVEEKEQDKLIDRATQIIGETLYPTNFGIMLVNEESHTLRTHPSYRLWEGEEAILLSLDEGITGHVIKTGKPMLVPDVQKEPLYVQGDSRTHSELCVPLKLGERVIGVINTEHNQPGFFTKDDERLLLTFAGQLAPAIERLRAEEKLITEKERLSVTLRSIGEGVITIDTQGNVILLNRVAEEMTGWLQEKAAGQLLQIVFKAEGIESCIKSQYPLLDEIKRSMFLELKSDIKLISSDGSVKIIDFSSAPLRDEKSQIIGFVLVFRDITDKLKLENEAQKAQKLEAIGILAGGIAHDFNNILAVMMGNIELAKLEGKLEEKIYERLNQAERAIERATGLTKQLLTFSKGGAPVKEITSIKTIIKESVDFILSGSNIGCKFFFGEDLWSVEVDIGQINQVINNLILNAMQSMLNGGVINVAVKNIRIKKNEQSPLTPGDYVNITIKDSGVGIPEENIDKVFDPYFTTKIGGSGLGLTTTYAIIKKHGGSIHVESVEGIGTEIHIYLPAIRQKAIIPKKVTSEIVKGTGKVLFMDDEVTITQVVEDFLIGIGYKVTIAHNGDEAIDYFDRSNKEGKPYGLVILDLTIPGGIGGKEVIKRLRVIDPKIRAIATSGYSNDPVMAKYNEHGFNDILPKPFKINELARIVKKYT